MHKTLAAVLVAAVIAGGALSGADFSDAEADPARPPVGSPGTLSGNVVTDPTHVAGSTTDVTASTATHLTLTGVTADQFADFAHESVEAPSADPWTYRDETRRDPVSQLKTYWAYFELPGGATAHDLSAIVSIDLGGTSTSETVSAHDLGPYVMVRWAGLPSYTPADWELSFRLTADGHEIDDSLELEQMDRMGDVYRVMFRDTQAS